MTLKLGIYNTSLRRTASTSIFHYYITVFFIDGRRVRRWFAWYGGLLAFNSIFVIGHLARLFLFIYHVSITSFRLIDVVSESGQHDVMLQGAHTTRSRRKPSFLRFDADFRTLPEMISMIDVITHNRRAWVSYFTEDMMIAFSHFLIIFSHFSLARAGIAQPYRLLACTHTKSPLAISSSKYIRYWHFLLHQFTRCFLEENNNILGHWLQAQFLDIWLALSRYDGNVITICLWLPSPSGARLHAIGRSTSVSFSIITFS